MKNTLRTLMLLGLTSLLSGCLLLSPQHGQTLSSRTASIPFQAWVPGNSNPLTVECMPTNRFGPEVSSHGAWRSVTNIPVSDSATLDLSNTPMYSAAKTVTLPEDCWYQNSNGYYYTSIRVFNGDKPLNTVERDGFKCVMEKMGERGNWLDSMPSSCLFTYRGTSTAVNWLVMRTQR